MLLTAERTEEHLQTGPRVLEIWEWWVKKTSAAQFFKKGQGNTYRQRSTTDPRSFLIGSGINKIRFSNTAGFYVDHFHIHQYYSINTVQVASAHRGSSNLCAHHHYTNYGNISHVARAHVCPTHCTVISVK